jgi:hypothetical protein
MPALLHASVEALRSGSDADEAAFTEALNRGSELSRDLELCRLYNIQTLHRGSEVR